VENLGIILKGIRGRDRRNQKNENKLIKANQKRGNEKLDDA